MRMTLWEGYTKDRIPATLEGKIRIGMVIERSPCGNNLARNEGPTRQQGGRSLARDQGYREQGGR